MTQEEKNALFERAKQNRASDKKKEEERKANGGWTREYEEVEYVSLQEGKQKVFRIMGRPLSERKDPTDCKSVCCSQILGDDGKKFRCIWPDKEVNKDWILWRIYNLITAGDWVDGQKNFKYAKKYPEIFQRVAKNNSENKYETGWKPSTFIVMNVIDRFDEAWHKEHKHTKLLSSRVDVKVDDEGKEIKYVNAIGIPKSCYYKIWDDVVEYAGYWDDYDIAVSKFSSEPWYKAFHPENDRVKIDAAAAKVASCSPLTEEELKYEMYDLDKFFNVTSYNKIKVKLGDFIKKVDATFGKNFYDELTKLADEEKERWKKEHPENEAVKKAKAEQENLPFDNDEEYADEDPVPEVKTSERKEISIDWDGLADGSYNGKVYEGIKEMTDEEKAMVVSVNEDGSFNYVKSAGRLAKDVNSGFSTPMSFHVDPLSGKIY